jgi:antitoxin YefM
VGVMKNTNVTNFRKNIYEMLETTIEYNEPINISTKNGNAIVLSEEDYNSLLETVYIMSVPGLKDEIIRRGDSGEEDFVSEDEVNL